MRHRNKGRKLGRNPSHQRALLRSLATALILTERETYEGEENAPKIRGRIVTTLPKAKEVRPFVEKCVTLARKAQSYIEAAEKLEPNAERGSSEWQTWRKSDQWQEWNKTISPAVALRRRAFQMLHDKEAVTILFEELGPRFVDRDGGYTRVLKLAKPRLGDAGTRAIIEFVGIRDRIVVKSEKPSFDDTPVEETPAETPVDDEVVAETTEDTVDEQEVVEDEATEEAKDE
jgi:large subunit ribosomal protein L17